VLCVRLDTIGDVLMTGPAMRALKPGRRLTLLTSTAGAAAAELMDEVDEAIVYDAPWMKAGGALGDAGDDREMVQRLRARRFDAAVIFTVYSQSSLPAALLCALADVPLRLAHCRENPYALLTEWVREREPHELVRHEVRRQLDLVATIGAYTADERLRLALRQPMQQRALALLDEAGVNRDADWLVVHPGASAPSRRYPLELLARACRTLTDAHGLQLVFTGSESERPLVEGVRAAVGGPSVSLAGRLQLAELAALLDAAPLLVAGNTGPVHLAAAVGTPVVDIYALTNPQHSPWQVPSAVLFNDVPCRWCYKSVCPEGHHLCLRGVQPDAVVSAALELLHDAAPAFAEPRALPRC
jgi:lipopolysaccharide heptosyltransferase II